MKQSSLAYFVIFFCLIPALISATVLESEAAALKPKQVVFIRYRIAPNFFQEVVDNFKETMQARGYSAGRNITYVDVLTSTSDRQSIPEVVAATNKYKARADMFITCGWVSMYARDILKKTQVPQLFVPVLKSVALEMLPSVTAAPQTNISGVYLMYPPEKILRMARLIMPAIKKYAYVYDSRIPADLVFKGAYEGLDNAGRHGIAVQYFDIAKGVDKVVQELKKNDIGAFGGIVGSFKNRKKLATAGVPAITSFTLDIDEKSIKKYVDEDNTLAGLFNPFGYCGAQAAEMTADIFDGTMTIQQTVPRPARQVAFINYQGAAKRHLYVPFEALEAVDLIIR